MQHVIVSSIEIQRHNYVPLTDENGELEIREEIIDLQKNELFFGCKDFYDIETTYETFWNRYNGDYRNASIIKVLQVRYPDGEIMGRSKSKTISLSTVKDNLLPEFQTTLFKSKDPLNGSQKFTLH